MRVPRSSPVSTFRLSAHAFMGLPLLSVKAMDSHVDLLAALVNGFSLCNPNPFKEPAVLIPVLCALQLSHHAVVPDLRRVRSALVLPSATRLSIPKPAARHPCFPDTLSPAAGAALHSMWAAMRFAGGRDHCSRPPVLFVHVRQLCFSCSCCSIPFADPYTTCATQDSSVTGSGDAHGDPGAWSTSKTCRGTWVQL